MSKIKVEDYRLEVDTDNTYRIKLFHSYKVIFQYEHLDLFRTRLLVDILRNENPVYIDTETSTLKTGRESVGEMESELTMMTLNVRIPEDGGDNSWNKRLPRIRGMLMSYENEHGPHIVGMQELRRKTWSDLLSARPRYNSFGKDRGDGEWIAIFYRTDRVELLEHGDFPLGKRERRDRGGCSRAYDKLDPNRDMKTRVVVWGRFLDKVTDKTFYAYNTHFPTGNHCERVGSARIMAERIAQRNHTSDPVIVLGDFNDGQRSDGVFNSSFRIFLENTGLVNSYRAVHEFHAGEEFSTTNKNFRNQRTGSGNEGRMIDFVLVTPRAIRILEADIDRTMFTKDGHLINCKQITPQGVCRHTHNRAKDLKMYSDHWAVWVSLCIT